MAFSGGTGTELDPYQVANAADLDLVRSYLSSYFIQTADIDLSGYANWISIGDQYTRFTGNYDGDNFNITGLTIITNAVYSGLFGSANNATIANVNIVQCSIAVTNSNVGAVVGNTGYTTIHRCYSSGQIIGGGQGGTGGIVGTAGSGTISECFSNANVTINGSNNWRCCGGIVGQANNAAIRDCYATGIITNLLYGGYESVGGIACRADYSIITNCYFSGTLIAPSWKWGIGNGIGGWTSDNIVNCYYNSACGGSGYGTPRTTAQMIYPTNLEYTDWDFDDVWIEDYTTDNSGYPRLRWIIGFVEDIPLFQDEKGRNRFWLINSGRRITAKELLICFEGSVGYCNVKIYDSSDTLLVESLQSGESFRVDIPDSNQGDYIYGYYEVLSGETARLRKVLVKFYNPGVIE